MSQPTKTFILDTNVLLSDCNALFSFAEHNVVIPLIVLEELDRHKDRHDEVGRNARETIRKLTELTNKNRNITRGVSLGTNLGTVYLLAITDVGGASIPELPPELQKDAGDNQIARFCLAYSEAHPDTTVTLITRDLALQLKCTTLGIDWESYRKFAVAATSPQGLYSGCVEDNALNVADVYAGHAAGGYVLPEEEVTRLGLRPNEFLICNNNGSVVARYTAPNKPLRVLKDGDSGNAHDKLKPRNKEQRFAMDLLLDPEIKLVTLVGKAGTGKTLIALAAGLQQTVGKGNRYRSLVVCRPIQPVGKEIGFLPGTLEEKMEPWIAPIKDNLRFLISEGKKGKFNEDVLQTYFDQGIIEIEAMSFIRGRSIANAYMLIDESQNLSLLELKTILTRAGEGTKIVLTGDIEQIDRLDVDSVNNGLSIAIERFKDHPIAGHITLTKGERSELATIASEVL